MNQIGSETLDKADVRHKRFEARVRYIKDSYILWRRNHLMMIGTFIILFLILVALLAPFLSTHHPYDQILPDRLSPPSQAYYLGTDSLGRDIYSRIVYGARVTLTIAFLVAFISTPLGLVIGVTAGWFGGAIDEILMRLSDVFLAFPRLILAIAFAAALGPGVENAIIAIAVANWPSYARLARAETLSVKNNDYIQVIQTLGAGNLRIMAGHIFHVCRMNQSHRSTDQRVEIAQEFSVVATGPICDTCHAYKTVTEKHGDTQEGGERRVTGRKSSGAMIGCRVVGDQRLASANDVAK